jgi:hypothetical protein
MKIMTRIELHLKQAAPCAVLLLGLIFMSAGSYCEGAAERDVSRERIGEKAEAGLGLSVAVWDMDLSNYEIASDGARRYAKLTGSTGTAQATFALPSGHYDIDVSYLSESVGQNTYGLYLNGTQIVSWLGKDGDDQWHLLSEQKWHMPRHIQIDEGSAIQIKALSGDGSLAIFDAIHFTPSSRETSSTRAARLEQQVRHEPVALIGATDDWITIYPEEYEQALRNPLKGFRSKHNEFGTLQKKYIYWNELENSAGDGVEQIKEFSNRKWSDLEKNNLKVIPRVYLSWPERAGGWPADMQTGDFTSQQFKERVVALIKKLGQAWDTDPRVAYVEMGLIGYWGEQEFPDTTSEIKEQIAAQFDESFSNKLVMIRWPHTYHDDLFNFGYYWDSFGHHNQAYYAFHLNRTAPRWKTAVIGGEVAYDWGNVEIQPGASPDLSLKEAKHRNHIINEIRSLHVNHLGWISSYDESNEDVRAGAEMMQQALGYRFVLTEVNYPKKISENIPFSVSFKIKNTGSSPFYYNWPVEISLLRPGTREVVWKQQYSAVDIRTWLPGDNWDAARQAYVTAPEIYTVNQNLELSGVEPGEYILALAVLDPAGHLPSLRFAINNYYQGGRHPIGKVGVEHTIDNFRLTDFDDMQADASLHYEILEP